MTAIAVTGAAGSLGRVLIGKLRQRAAIDRIVALDVVSEPPVFPPGVEYHQVDVRDVDLARHFAGCDQVVHLAFVVERGSRDLERVQSINVGGTQNVMSAAAEAGVKQVVYASSIAAYGAHPENLDGPLDESAPIRGNTEFYYSRTKAEVEQWLDGFEAEHPEIAIARLRPTIFLGENGARSLSVFQLPVFPFFASKQPVHVTHEDDVADAFMLVLEKRARGAYNVASNEPLPMGEWARAMGKKSVPLPAASLHLANLAYRARLIDVEPTWFRFGARYPITVTSEKLRALGWKPRYPTTESVLRVLAGGAGRPARVMFGMLQAVTRVRGSLGDSNEVEGMEGTLNVVLTGEHPSSWHFWSRNRKLGVGHRTDPSARATVTLAEKDFVSLLRGDLNWSTATMIGKVRFSGDGEFAMLAGGLFHQLAQLLKEGENDGWPRRMFTRALQKASGVSPGR